MLRGFMNWAAVSSHINPQALGSQSAVAGNINTIARRNISVAKKGKMPV